jgi:hypothetical protein
LVIGVPVGYVKTPDMRIEKTPDLQVQEAVDRVFKKFLELGTAWKVVEWHREEGLSLPSTSYCHGGHRVQWKPPKLGAVLGILKNPVYAGVFVYGRHKKGRMKRANMIGPAITTIRDPNAWPVVIRNHHEGYIDIETFEKIHRMPDNVARAARPATDRGFFRVCCGAPAADD